MLRFEATVHNTKALRCRRGLDSFPEVITRLAGMAERFCTAMDCVDISFLNDTALDELPLPSRVGATRVGGIDLNKPRIRAALAAALALAAAPHGFTVAEHAARVQAMTSHDGYTIRQAAYDPKVPRERFRRQARPHPPLPSLSICRPHHRCPAHPAGPGHHPNLAGIRSPRRCRKPATWTRIDRDYETLRIGMQALFQDLGIAISPAAA